MSLCPRHVLCPCLNTRTGMVFMAKSASAKPTAMRTLSELSDTLPALDDESDDITKAEYVQMLSDTILLDRHLLICRK